jgi:hypothetical protein
MPASSTPLSATKTQLDPRDARGIKRWLRRVRPWHAATLWVLLMWPLAHWGLPSSRYDKYLFDGDPPWEPERYQAARALNALRARNAGADTDLDPLTDRAQPIELTADDAARGQILLRYRLYSRQPDEMITFRALQRMKPRERDFDPQMYQYGGGYVYLVGGAIGVTSVLGLTRLTSDLNVYLAQPELFGAFYVVARSISLIFAAAALSAAFRLASRAGGRAGGWTALLLVAASPVFMTGALEAKPHLPAACMTLWTIEFALRYWARELRRDAVCMGLSAGYACGLVLTGVAALITIAALGIALFVRKRRVGAPLAAVGIAVIVYLLTNPYVAINLLVNPAAIASNIGNSTAMYALDRFGDGALRVFDLLIKSIGGVTLGIGLVGAALLLSRYRAAALIASAAGVAMMLLCIAIGAGKPFEFARFQIVPAMLLCICCAVALAEGGRRSRGMALGFVLVCLFASDVRHYAKSFALDAGGVHDSRSDVAAWLAEHLRPGDSVGVLQEPAPYCIPPLDFATRRVLLLPPKPMAHIIHDELPEWLVFADDHPLDKGTWSGWSEHYETRWNDALVRMEYPSPIAWANKPVFVYRRIGRESTAAP